MSESNQEVIVVRDRDRVRRLVVEDDWTTTTLLASLSADPRSFSELADAWLRYRPEQPLGELTWSEDSGELPARPWVLLDMACFRVVAGGGASLPGNPAAFQRDEGPCKRGMPVVWINMPPDWHCVTAGDWQAAFPPVPMLREPLDVRGILFGRTFAEGIARRTLAIGGREPLPTEYHRCSAVDRNPDLSDSSRQARSQWRALTVRVHVDWLLTPREDLEGKPPRHFLHCGREWVERELNNREEQWIHEGRPPRALDRGTFAYRYGPLGRHEVVMYFDLCREVIQTAWEQIVETPAIEVAALTDLLQSGAQSWLQTGSIDDDPTPPGVIIERERRRMPLVDDGTHLDCDCRLCQMEDEVGWGPAFIAFDGHHLELDDEFAFSLSATREEWEEHGVSF